MMSPDPETMEETATPDPIVRFYRLEGTDDRGRTLDSIWKWDHRHLEEVHDYIQWLFPLREKSPFNPAAPVLTDHTIEAFRRDDILQERLKRSLEVMLRFYGLRLGLLANEAIEIIRGSDFEARGRNWLARDNHNHLRLTRMLTSIRLLGLPLYSAALFQCLEGICHQYPDRISSRTQRFWASAASP